MTGRLWTSLARLCATAFLGLGLALVAMSAADAAAGRAEPVLRAASQVLPGSKAASPMAALHAPWVKSPAGTLTAGGVDNPRPDDGGAASTNLACPAETPAAGAATLLPPRRLGALVQAGAALPERPPKARG